MAGGGFMEWVRASDAGGTLQQVHPAHDRVSSVSHPSGSHRLSYGRARRSDMGWWCRCGQDFSALAPKVDPRELFVNVTVRSIEEHIPVKSIQTWIHGVMGQVMGGGKNHYSHKISETHFKENELRIKSEIMKAFLLRGWQAEVTNMVLPPSRDQLGPSRYLQMTRDALPIFMAFRVHIGRRHWHVTCDCSEISPFYRPIDKKECDTISMELQDSLQQQQYMRQQRCPILAEVNVGDAAGEMHVLYNMHWSEEQAADCILRSRKQVTAGGEDGTLPQQYGPGLPVTQISSLEAGSAPPGYNSRPSNVAPQQMYNPATGQALSERPYSPAGLSAGYSPRGLTSGGLSAGSQYSHYGGNSNYGARSGDLWAR